MLAGLRSAVGQLGKEPAGETLGAILQRGHVMADRLGAVRLRQLDERLRSVVVRRHGCPKVGEVVGDGP